MMLIDKSYYDYDYEKVQKLVTVSETKRSDEWVMDKLRGFGLPVDEAQKAKRPSAEEVQSYLRKDLKDKD